MWGMCPPTSLSFPFFAPGRTAALPSKGHSESKSSITSQLHLKIHYIVAFGGCYFGMVTTALNLAEIGNAMVMLWRPSCVNQRGQGQLWMMFKIKTCELGPM